MKKIKVGVIQQNNTADIRTNLMNLAKNIETDGNKQYSLAGATYDIYLADGDKERWPPSPRTTMARHL